MYAPLFDATQYHRAQPVASYWRAITAPPAFAPLSRDTVCDVAIIGAGFAGLSAALHLCRDYHLSVAVLEAGEIAWGASGRNGGFVTMPASKLSSTHLFNRFGDDAAISFLQSQQQAIQMVADLIAQESIDAQRCGDGSYTVAHKASSFADLKNEYAALQRAGISCQLLSPNDSRAQLHNTEHNHGALRISDGYALNPLAFCADLARAAARHGAQLFTQTTIKHWHKENGVHHLHSDGATVRAKTVYLAGNAYRDKVDARVVQQRFLSALSNIIVTAPIAASRWQQLSWTNHSPIADTKNLLHYYRRLSDDRLLLGARGDLNGNTAAAEKMRQQLQRDIATLFPPLGDTKIEFFWNGLVSLSRKMLPTFGALPDDNSVYFHIGCFGNGVNTMPWIGRAIARQIAGREQDKFDRAELYQALPARVPSSRFLRRAGLQLAYWHYALRDRFF